MDTAFVASSFHDSDRGLVDGIRSVVEAFGIRPMAGRHLGGKDLNEGVRKRIKSCDALIALFTTRKQGDGWNTHAWVLGEYEHAHTIGKPTIAIVENSIDWSHTPYGNREYITLDRGRSHEAMLELMQQVGTWKQEAGVPLNIAIQNSDIIQKYAEDPKSVNVRYRTIVRAEAEPWVEPQAIYQEPNAIVARIKIGPVPDHLIELEVTCGRVVWQSAAVRQFLQVELKRVTP
jgi:hypothetical protein